MQKSIGIFYGSTSGDTKKIAHLIYEKFGDKIADIFNVSQTKANKVDKYPYLILGSSTWGIGEVQDDMEYFVKELKDKNLDNKLIALFGLGNQLYYPHSFVNSMGHIYNVLKNTGARFVGQWSIEDYNFFRSTALVDSSFIGLPLDIENQKEIIPEIIDSWVKNLKNHFKMKHP
ncbi:MAG: flavodoxin [Bacteroidales bacterium]|nr:flavodoxin [Bacteroidales bacterium]